MDLKRVPQSIKKKKTIQNKEEKTTTANILYLLHTGIK